MRYIADANGYLKEVSFGASIECNGAGCTEYTGSVPSGYDSLVDWFVAEAGKLYRWKIVDGELTLDSTATAPAEAKEEHYIKTYYSISQFGLSGQPTTNEVFEAMPNSSRLVICNRVGNDYNISDVPTTWSLVELNKGQYNYGSGIATKVNSSLKETYQFDWYNGSSVNAWTRVGSNATLLWENSKPTSTFAAQDITIAGGTYDYFMIVSHTSINVDVCFLPVTIAYKGKNAHLIGAPNNKIARRLSTINSAGTTVTFGTAEYGGTYGATTANDEYIIPMYIYGMRLN